MAAGVINNPLSSLRRAIQRYIEDPLAEELSQHKQFFHSVFHKVDLEKVRAKQLHYCSAEQLNQLAGFVAHPALAGAARIGEGCDHWSSGAPLTLFL